MTGPLLPSGLHCTPVDTHKAAGSALCSVTVGQPSQELQGLLGCCWCTVLHVCGWSPALHQRHVHAAPVACASCEAYGFNNLQQCQGAWTMGHAGLVGVHAAAADAGWLVRPYCTKPALFDAALLRGASLQRRRLRAVLGLLWCRVWPCRLPAGVAHALFVRADSLSVVSQGVFVPTQCVWLWVGGCCVCMVK